MSQDRPARPEESGVVQALEARDLTLLEALGKYRLLGALGHGGMADVYLAVADGPEGFRKLCVLKLLKDSMADDEEFRAMFLDEARLAARLNHPNIVQTFEVGETHGRLMIAMEYVEGQPATRVRRRLAPEQLPLTAYVSLLCDVLDALEYAHGLADFDGSSLGIVHRDVSPHNIIVGYDGRVKLVDFGIAKSSAAMQETQAGVLKGKVGYMAPEQASMRSVDGRADVFSVGVILWEAIAGRRLSEGLAAQDVLVRRVDGSDPKIASVAPSVDAELAAICDRAMARFPEHRHESAAELQADLEAWLAKHGEPNRKELSRSLRDAFAAEREQLRTLVEERMADSCMSGMRQALLEGSSLPSLARLHASSEAPSRPPPAASLPPAAAPVSDSELGPTQLGPTELGLTGVRGALPLTSRAVIFAAAAVVAAGIGAAMYLTRSPSPSPSAPSSRAATRAAEPAEAVSAEPAAPPSAEAAAPVTPSLTTTVARPSRPVFLPPAAKGSPPVAHPAAAAPAPTTTPTSRTTSAPPTGLTNPASSKQPSRPLDEKDPYAP